MTFQDITGKYKQIKGFPNYYITEFGEIFSDRLRGHEKEPHLHKMTPKNPGKNNKYLNIILCNKDGQFTKSVHRLVAEHFVDGFFEGAVVNHIDGNNRNNAATNLEWTTARDNIHKSYKTSGVSAKRNYKTWMLFDCQDTLLGSFTSHNDMEEFVKKNHIDASPTQMTKKRNSRGYYVVIKGKQTENCNDYPNGVACR
jgi:hypothetical protein